MLERFVDTSGWAELADRTLAYHARAATLVAEVWKARGRLVTTGFVLAELTALLTRPLRMPKALQIHFLAKLRADPSIEIIHVDPTLERESWRLWETRPDKDWGLVDCSSFVVMQRRGLVEALTSDHHFEQAGFVRLLK